MATRAFSSEGIGDVRNVRRGESDLLFDAQLHRDSCPLCEQPEDVTVIFGVRSALLDDFQAGTSNARFDFFR